VKTIVVGTDGSDSSFGAVAQAAELAAALGATVHVVCVAQMGQHFPVAAMSPVGMPANYDNEVLDAAAAAVARAGDVAKGCGATTRTEVVQGEPSQALIDYCENVRADLLVVGSRGMSGAARFLLGSVPNRCAHHAPCSVLIARTG
jgi:nucleotide-binding universal stress UspA family protein